ncbi:MAG: DUF1653 domain-containing protein [Lachnospiraceae bacterium]|nr:DUF1653 domain-containing protein [Lachnospiraceae bacterium]
MERRVWPGEVYRHFKGELYQVVAVAVHSETGEEMVVYQALYGDFSVYVRPFGMFVGEVDREKYPEAGQRFRFERAALPGRRMQGEERREREEREEREEGEGRDTGSGGVSRGLEEFLDAGSVEERMECLRGLRDFVSQEDLDSIYVVLDMQAFPGSVGEQLDAVIRCLAMQQRYEGRRLR